MQTFENVYRVYEANILNRQTRFLSTIYSARKLNLFYRLKFTLQSLGHYVN